MLIARWRCDHARGTGVALTVVVQVCVKPAAPLAAQLEQDLAPGPDL
jgi:hypothetical protein